MEKVNAMAMQSKQILPPSIGLDRRSGSAASSTGGGGGGRQHKLKQRFTVIRKLGKGTYGKVQLAVNKETGQEVAIKTIKKTKIENEQDLERVRREIQIMSSIEHPHIIHIYEVFENKDKIVLIMQYAPGGELYEYVSQSKVLDEVEARRLFRQVATAIYYCHKNKICHRDLKLENILLDEKNNAKLADFGLSNVFDKSRQLKTFCGSPLYASPEIVQGSPYEGPEVDCWSLGVLLYTLVYGAMPFDGSNFKRLVKQISEASYYEPKQRSQASPLISRLLCADPVKRATIFDICQDPWVNGHQLLVPPTLPSPTTGSQQRPKSPSSPNAQQQQQAHTSLLKVAQDMANLTPVRLDILLALAPAPTAVSDTKPINHSRPDERPNGRAPKRKASLVEEEVMKASRQQEQQERQTKLMEQLDGSSLIEVDELRATSPVASYRVRDLAVEGETTKPEDQTSGGQTNPIVEPQNVQEHQKDQERQPQSETNGNINERGNTEPSDVMEAPSIEEDNAPAEDPPHEAAMVIEEQICDEKLPQSSSASHSGDQNDLQTFQTAPDEIKEIEIGEQEVEKEIDDLGNSRAEMVSSSIDVTNSTGQSEGLTEAPVALEANILDKESSQAKNIDQPEAAPEDVYTAEGEECAARISETTTGETKTKKVRRKIIVVKKKKKVVKKEVASEQEGADEFEAKDKEKAPEQDGESASLGKRGSFSSGPGKVRIPDTFQPTGDSTSSTSTLSRASRRQSALIADVSQKLLQQQQQHPSSTAAIEEDQKQLASVRVSDKKSEFERRASLATNQDHQRSGSISPRGSQNAGATSKIPEESQTKIGLHEPELAASRLEETCLIGSIGHTIVEPVNKPQPLKTCPLKAIALGLIQEPLTPTGTVSASGVFPEALSDRAEVTDSSLATNPNEDRSDSVETIKADIEAGFQERLSPRQTNVRSSLQINLGPAREELDKTFVQRRSSGSVVGSSAVAGPAPIARSYKKVTFTKDGSCVTETGRIYSTQADDGTVRRIERKSKVTHYPSESGSGQVGESAVEETREETVYEDGRLGFWPSDTHRRASSLQRDRPLERLIMPTGDYYEQAEDSHGQQMPHPSSRPSIERMDSASSCSSGSTDVFDDIFDTWTGAISMFSKRNNRRLSGLRDSLINRAFGIATPGSARQQASGSQSMFKRHIGSSLAGTPAQERCGSVEPARGLFEGFDGFPRMRRHHHRRHHRDRHPNSSSGRSSVDASGYESDAPLDRPASAAPGSRQTLSSARGFFGSSNLSAFPRQQPSGATESLFGESLAADDDIFESLNSGAALGPFGGSLLMQEIQAEQEKMLRKLAQQRKQLWKGSTPALNEIPDHNTASGPICIEQSFLRSRADSTSSGQQQHPSRGQQQARRVVTTVYKTLHQASGQPAHLNQSQSSGGMQRSLRQSTPLDPTPTRRNTANLSDHLPPRQPLALRRSTSKTSSLTCQMANMQIGDIQANPSTADGTRQRHVSASFIELKRNSSSASSNQQLGAALKQNPVPSNSGESSSVFCEAPLTPSTCHSNLSNSLNSRVGQQLASAAAAAAGQQDNEANSRIQSWLQQSSGNLSISSGSKSSASDTLPSSGRSDVPSSMLRGDESVGTTVMSSSMFSSQQRQRKCDGGQMHQLPPIAGPRSLASSSRQSPIMSKAPPTTISAASMTTRSSSKQPLCTMGEPAGKQITQSELLEQLTHRAEEKIVSMGCKGSAEIEDSSEMFARQSISSSTAQASGHSALRFAFPSGEACEQQVVSEQRQQQLTTTTTSTKQQVFTHRVMSPQMMSSAPIGADPWFQEQQTSVAQPKQGFIDDSFTDDFDSLVGSGAELDSISSSSLLDQLRARGYRSMINQRLVNTQQQQQQQQVSHQLADANVITTSSTSITMSSSGVGGAQPEEERPARMSTSKVHQHQRQQPQAANELVAQLIANDQRGGEKQQLQLQTNQEDASLPPIAAQASNGPTNENGNSNGLSMSAACATGCEQGAQVAANLDNQEETVAEDEDVREAKANIKGYLDRMREMETFLKSMHEEEERFQKQRQDMFLFNNLLLSAKLNGLKSNNSLEPAFSESFQASPTLAHSRGHSSAPIGYSAFESPNSNGFLASVRPSDESSSSGFHYQQSGPLPTSLSCFSSDLYKPSISLAATVGPRVCSPLPTEDYSRDPLLEPVQPLQLSYHPIAMAQNRNTWRRSKSQLSDQFNDYSSACQSGSRKTPTRTYSGLEDYNQPTGSNTSRRPLSANIDSMPHLASLSSSPYFPSRQRRSVSQMRHSTIASPSVGSHDINQMASEYKSSFGPNLSQLRGARSPMRFRATSPHVQVNLHDKSDSDTQDDDMHDYRASNYVPKVVPDCAPTERGRRLSRRSSTLEIGASLIGKSTPHKASEIVAELIKSSERRNSVQTISSQLRANSSERERSASPAINRRRSLAGASERPQAASVSNLDNSRLSELEQRIQANKRRRQELLSGINNSAPISESKSNTTNGVSIKSADYDENEAEAFAFERPSRPSARWGQEAGVSGNSSPVRSSAGRAGGGSPRSRPSRLESMEARIKRRSYCVRVSSPDRTRAKSSRRTSVTNEAVE